jgi:hypothetical protein
MNTAQARSESETVTRQKPSADRGVEVIVIAMTDGARAKDFYGGLGGGPMPTSFGRTGTPNSWFGSSREKYCRHERLRRRQPLVAAVRQEPNELRQFPVSAATGPARTVPFARTNGPAGQRPASKSGGKIGRFTDGAALNDGTRIRPTGRQPRPSGTEEAQCPCLNESR